MDATEENIDENDNNNNDQQGSGPPPEIIKRQSSLDIDNISQEIDNYIFTLTSSKQDQLDPPDLPTFVEQFALLLESKVAEYDFSSLKWIQVKDEDAAAFLQATFRLSSLYTAFSLFAFEPKYAYTINRIGGVLTRVMSFTENEFKSFVSDYKIQDSDQEQDQQNYDQSDDNIFPGYSQDVVSELIKLSKVMAGAGHDRECFRVYFIARRNALEESLQKLGFEKYSIEDVQKMPWEQVETEIQVWIKTFNQFAMVQFPNERKLSDVVFSDHPRTSESLFCRLSYGVVIQLLNFGGAVAIIKRSGEKLFKFLDVYETLRDIPPKIEHLFPEEWMKEVKSEASIIRLWLGDSMILIFQDLESSIRADTGKTPVPGGAVHPLTRYTMNYMKYACEYSETLDQVFRGDLKFEKGENLEVENETTPFQDQIINLMDTLDANVEAKSKLYKHPAQSSIFLMNNGRYILQKIKGSSEVHRLLGDAWYRKKSSDLRQYHKGYQRETWGNLLNCLHTEGLISHGKVVKPALKERFKSFNALFEEIHKTQSTWVVSDVQMQSELRVSISNMVVPAYRSFLGRYSQAFAGGRQSEKYIKYQADDIEACILDLFEGNTAPQQGRRKQ